MKSSRDIDHITDPIKRVLQNLQSELNSEIRTLTSTMYNFYKNANMPRADTLTKRADKSWAELMTHLNLPKPLSRNTLSRLSNALHLLEKRIVTELKLSWNEYNIPTTNGSKLKIVRPDALNMESVYLRNGRLLALDVKLSVASSMIMIYKYLSLFEKGLQPSLAAQKTFFPEWLPKDAVKVNQFQHIYKDGQLGLFFDNNILFICYLIGTAQKNLQPGDEITRVYNNTRTKKCKKKRLPMDMEIRFVEFNKLPALYAEIAGIDYDKEKQQQIKPILQIAEIIKRIVLISPNDADKMGKEIYELVKANSGKGDMLNLKIAMLAKLTGAQGFDP